MKRTTRVRLAAGVALAALALAGCGGDDGGDADNEPTGNSAASEPPSLEEDTAADEEPAPDVVAASEAADANNDLLTSVMEGSDRGIMPQEDVFNVLSPWNTVITEKAAHPLSEEMLEQAKFRLSLDRFGQPVRQATDEGIYINTVAWTVPVVADGVPTVVTCRQVQCGDGGEDLTLNVPAEVDPDPRYDGWFTIFDGQQQKAYDFWRARRENDGTISYQFMREWDLDGPGFNRPYVVAARASGLPLFAGLIRPGELERGTVNHALAISIPGPDADYFIQPASSTNGNNNIGDSVPEGARIRLRADFELERPFDQETGKRLPWSEDQQAYANRLVEALKTYGAIVVDRAAVPTMYFEETEKTFDVPPLLRGYELQSIRLEDFEVMNFADSDRFPYPPQDQLVDPSELVDTGTSSAVDVDPSTPGIQTK